MNARELLAVMEQTWRQLDAAVDGLDEAAMTEPGVVGMWSVKDLLGHVVAWEQVALRHLEEARSGATMTSSGDGGVDAYNVAEAARREHWTVAQVLAELTVTRERLRTVLEQTDAAGWSAPVQVGEWRGTIGELVGGDVSGDGPGTHAAEHAQHIQAWREQRSGVTGST